MSIPSLHCPVVSASVPSASITASSKNARRLGAPDPHPRLVDRRLQRLDRRLVKPPAEIARRGRIGNPLRAQRVEIHLVLPPPLDILQTRPATQHVVRDAQHVIRFVIRQVHLQHLHVLDRSPSPTPCAAPTDASRRSRRWPARAPAHCAHTARCLPGTSASAAPSTSAAAAAARFVVCAAPPVGVYWSSLEMSSRLSELLVARRETLLRGTGISSVLFTRRAANALVLGLVGRLRRRET